MSTRPLTPGQLARVAEFYARQMTDKGHAVEPSLVLRMAAINDAWRVAFATITDEEVQRFAWAENNQPIVQTFVDIEYPVLHVPTVTADPNQLDPDQYRTSLLEVLRRVKVLIDGATTPDFDQDFAVLVDKAAFDSLRELLP